MGAGQELFSKQLRKGCAALCITLQLAILLSSCGGESQSQRAARQNKTTLDQLIGQAQEIGVPQNLLQPVVQQESQLSITSAPLTLLSTQTTNDYYGNIARRYHLLSIQVKGLEEQSTQQLGYQASQDMQNFENALSQRQSQGFVEVQPFADQLIQDQNLLEQAQYPKHFVEISNSAREATLALQLMGTASDDLTTLHNTIKQLGDAGLDVTAIQQQEQDDLEAFHTGSRADDYQQLIDQLKTQLQATTTLSTQAIPYVGATKLKQFGADIEQMKSYQIDTTEYQRQLDRDRNLFANARSLNDYLQISAQIDSDSAAARIPLLKGEAASLLKGYNQEVDSWGANHQYHNKFDSQSYNLDYEYDREHGFSNDLSSALQRAQSADDYQAVIDQINTYLLHLKAMEADYNDKSSYSQPHSSDLQLIEHYKMENGTVIVVSLIEQALRFYQNGKLVKAFLVTTGQYYRPTPPGLWQIFVRQSPTIFKSWEKKGSAFWYPDTNINYAMEYRDDGYYFHDSWWRLDYGPGTNFPHVDRGGDQEFAGNGSHGCINMTKDMAGWLYQNSSYGTSVIIY